MTDSKEWCDGDWRWRSSSKPFAGAESGSPGRALEAGKRGSPGRPVQAGIRGKRLRGRPICVPSGRNQSHVGRVRFPLRAEMHGRSHITDSCFIACITSKVC